MMWSLLYTAISDQLARQELAGAITDEELELKLEELHKMEFTELTRRYFDILGQTAPKEEDL